MTAVLTMEAIMDAVVQSPSSEVIWLGEYKFDLWRREVFLGDKKVRLGDPEAVIFRAIGEANGEFISNEALRKAWADYKDMRAGAVTGNVITTQVCRLRKKLLPLGGRPIRVEYSLGYAL